MIAVNIEKLLYRFGNGAAEGDHSMTSLLGGKGAGLAEMTSLSVPVPPGFTITTDVCRTFLHTGELPAELSEQVQDGLSWLEEVTGKSFGDPANPLLLSVRSGAPISMPGMMDTVLNIGLNNECVWGLADVSQSPCFALDSYRRLLLMFGTVVLDMPRKLFTDAGDIAPDSDAVGAELELQNLIRRYQRLYIEHHDSEFPQDPQVQLQRAILAVFESWNSERARFYRKINGIPDELGTAVTVQAMVFGNQGEDSGTGVGFTRNPSTGVKEIFAEFIPNAQGEDIVAGTHTPLHIAELQRRMPTVYDELIAVTQRLEEHYRDAQDFEFTIEAGRLFLLQTRSAKRTTQAAVRMAVDMTHEGLITRQQALARVNPASLPEILMPQLDLSSQPAVLMQGLPASPGAAVGKIALSSSAAVALEQSGKAAILVTEETTADDIQGMAAARGFLTARGGVTSHAAVVARGMGKCCITSAKNISFLNDHRCITIGGKTFREGDWLSMDGGTGCVYTGQLPTRQAAKENEALDELLAWALVEGACAVRANADTPTDAALARRNGAAGIGLCRTEHMFFQGQRLQHMRTMILATNAEERVRALDVLLPMQKADFEAIFRAMAPLPVTIRLLDPPLHEFLPSIEEITGELAEMHTAENWTRCMELDAMRSRARALAETNPMMGHRGCRLSLTYPEILEMQVRAILLAALQVREEGLDPLPEIMVPLVASEEEMRELAGMIRATAELVALETGLSCPYRIGTMIELPRAAMCASSIAQHVQFISFGTNDLTQMTYGFSRDDAPRYLDTYLQRGLLETDPFVTIDEEGVGQLIALAIKSVRAVDPSIKIGVCGEHGGDPKSIHFFRKLGVDYVSCSPARIPVAQLAAAQNLIA